MLAPRSKVSSHWHRDGGKSGRSPIETFPRHLPKLVEKWGSVLWFSVGGTSCHLCLSLGLVTFLLAHVSWIPASVRVGVGVQWGFGGGFPHRPCLSACLSGYSQVTSKCTPVPGLPALLRHRGNSPGQGACLGSSVESSPMYSETSLSSLPQAPSPQHLERGGLF